ncbi:hypothetical protein CBL_07426 [Carabus blaptoides fortunei]
MQRFAENTKQQQQSYAIHINFPFAKHRYQVACTVSHPSCADKCNVQNTRSSLYSCVAAAQSAVLSETLIQVKIQPSPVFVNSLMNYVVFCFLETTNAGWNNKK